MTQEVIILDLKIKHISGWHEKNWERSKRFRKIKKAQQNKTLLQKATWTLEAKHISQGTKQEEKLSWTSEKWDDKNYEKAKHICVSARLCVCDKTWPRFLTIYFRKRRVDRTYPFTLAPWKGDTEQCRRGRGQTTKFKKRVIKIKQKDLRTSHTPKIGSATSPSRPRTVPTAQLSQWRGLGVRQHPWPNRAGWEWMEPGQVRCKAKLLASVWYRLQPQYYWVSLKKWKHVELQQ